MKIDYNSTQEQVMHDFNNAFPYLRIEFLPNAQKPTLLIGDINKNIRECSVDLPGSTTVTELESIFRNKLGIPVRLLRKSGNIWLETSITNNWTLTRQNQHGEEISGQPKN